MKNKKASSFVWLAALSALVLAGCSAQYFAATKALNDVDNGQKIEKERPFCEVPEVDYQMDSQVIAFEVTKDTGAKFGFNLIVSWLKLFEASFRVKDSMLTVKTDMREYLKPEDPLAPAEGESHLKQSEVGFNFSIYKINAGFDSYSKTPFYTVLKRALDQSLTRTAAQLTAIQPLWSSAVVSVPEKGLYIIPAGSNAGIHVGDQFAVYNVNHIWEGAPCESRYRMRINTTDEPIAILEVRSAFDLTPNATLLKVRNQNLNVPINQGAFVFAHQLVGDRSANTLKRSVAIRDIRPFQVGYLEGGKTIIVDFTQYLKEALAPIVLSKGLYIKEALPRGRKINRNN